MTIGILDYRCGNVGSLRNAFKQIGQDVCVVTSVSATSGLSRLVLPGVGNFGHAARELRASGLDRLVTATSKPVLGICVGFQLLTEGSDESPEEVGLGIIPWRVTKLPKPHVGWDKVEGVGTVYFVHHYGQVFMHEKGNYLGVQFHPEKSGAAGLSFLKKWSES